MSKKDPESPATTSMAYDDMAPSWTKIQTVLDGTEAMRASGRNYLPQHAEESDDAYDERLKRATLFNLTKITQESLVGRPFSEPLQYSEDMPEQIQTFLEDVDQCGTNVHVFARDWFSDGLAKVLSHVYVDFPRTDAEQPTTLADDEALKPYWVHIRPEQLIFADSEVVNGREVLREIRIMEEVNERVGFAELITLQIRRVYLEINEDGDRIGVVELYQEDRSSKKRKKPWLMVDTYTYSLGIIPLVTFYANRDGFMHGVPPLEDLADLNIAHWQSTSDQRAVLTVARFPILALSGGTDEDNKLTIGPNEWLYAPDPAARFYYVEHSGAAIEAGRKDLMDLESQMSEYGAEFLKKRPGGMTATARALDSAEATSPLQDMTLRFKYAIDMVLYYTALWMGVENPGTLTLVTDFGPEEVNQSELAVLQFARTNRDISRRAFLEELKRRGALSEEYGIDEDAEVLEEESMALGIGGGLPGEEEPETPGETEPETEGEKEPEV